MVVKDAFVQVPHTQSQFLPSKKSWLSVLPEERDIITETLLFSPSFIGHEALSAWNKMDGRSCRQNKRYGIYLIGIYQDLLFKIAATVNDLFGLTVSFRSSEMSSHVAAKGLLTCKVPFFSERVCVLYVSGWVKLVSGSRNFSVSLTFIWVTVWINPFSPCHNTAGASEFKIWILREHENER